MRILKVFSDGADTVLAGKAFQTQIAFGKLSSLLVPAEQHGTRNHCWLPLVGASTVVRY